MAVKPNRLTLILLTWLLFLNGVNVILISVQFKSFMICFGNFRFFNQFLLERKRFCFDPQQNIVHNVFALLQQKLTKNFIFKLEEAERVWKIERDDLLRDQAGLQNLHDNLLQDYDKLLKDKETQKEIEKHLRDEIRKLQV